MTIDFWVSREAYVQFTAGHHAEYKAIDDIGEQLTVNEKKMGWFESVAE